MNQTAAIVYDAKKQGGTQRRAASSAAARPKNFMLQTEPQIQEVLGPGGERATTTSCKFTDARPDTGGLSGATPQRGDDLGQGRSGQAARHGDLLRRFDHRAAAPDRLQPDALAEAAVEAPLRPLPGVDPPPRSRVRSNPGETGGVSPLQRPDRGHVMHRFLSLVILVALAAPAAAQSPQPALWPSPGSSTTRSSSSEFMDKLAALAKDHKPLAHDKLAAKMKPREDGHHAGEAGRQGAVAGGGVQGRALPAVFIIGSVYKKTGEWQDGLYATAWVVGADGVARHQLARLRGPGGGRSLRRGRSQGKRLSRDRLPRRRQAL